jgi:valyl-tRNA synthetase
VAQAIANGTQDFDEAMIAAMNLVPDEYRGLDRFEARKRVVADITAEGLAVMVDGEPYVENKKIMQPFGDRSKVVIEPMLTDQWFVDTKQIVQPAIDAVRDGTVQILPEGDKKVYFHWLENIEPWCISRQLWWGHQVPVWYDDEGNRYCASSEAEARSQAGGKALYRDPDVLDTWFSSGLWPIGTLGWPEDTPELAKYFPTSVLITGQDILFFWVARMMMMQLAVVDEIPFHDVYLHGLVRDAKGKKMSKSTGNVIDPLEIIDEYGADALRFTNASMASLGGVLKIDMQRIAGYRNFGTKLWNAARFAEMNDCKPSVDFDPRGVSQTVNKWIVGETARVREAVDAALAQYRFNDAANALYAYVWGKVCDWYVELSKPLFQGDDEAAKTETQATMAWTIDQCLILLHPIMPYVTEQLWGDIAPRARMLIHADWPEYSVADLVDSGADVEMNWVVNLIEQVRSVRASMHVPAGARIDMVELGLSAEARAALDGNLSMIKRLARIETISAANEAPKGAVTIAVDGGTFCLPLADVIDIAAEQARLQKNLDKLGREAGGIGGKLANEKFLAKAPAAVVEENRTRLAVIEDETAKLMAAMERLRALV